MRWKCVAWLVTVLSTASAQEISIDDDINGILWTATETARNPTTNEIPTTTAAVENNIVPANHEDNGYGDDYSTTTIANIIDNGETDTTNTFEPITEPTSAATVGTTETDTESAEDGDVIGVEPDSNYNNSRETDEDFNDNVDPSSSEYVSRETQDPIEIEGGYVQGHYLHGDSNIISYIDIPYGSFTRLFQAPTKAEQWSTIHSVKEHQKRCPQIDENEDYAGDVDCLTLSVFAPANVQNASVLFHIYDGDFKLGSGDHSIYGPEYLVTRGVILVLPNYRLNVLGFLCLNNQLAPGNAGLKDLTLALEWTKNNIEKFGGNPSKIVVSGDGVSGALAGYLALSPTSRPYISGVITESGSMLAHWAIDRNPNATAVLLTEAIIENMNNEMNAEIIVRAARNINFRPCIETDPYGFLTATPWEILHNEEDKIEIPFIMGSASHAGLQEAMIRTEESLSALNQNFSIFLPNDLKFENGKEIAIAEEIKKLYFGDNDIGLAHLEELSFFYTDAYYLGPSIRASRALREAGAKVYFYEFSFVGDLNRMSQSLSSTMQGAVRGDLTSYIFTQDGEVPKEESAEELKVNLITDLWVSLLQKGVPSAPDVTWEPMENDAESEEKWLSIGKEVEQMTGMHKDRLALWTKIYENHFIENLAMDIRSSLFLIVTGILLLGLRK